MKSPEISGWGRALLASRACLIVAALGFLSNATAQAQLPQTRLYSVFPPGAKAGTTVELTLAGGADLDEVNRLLFDHPGITAVSKMQGNQPVPNAFVVTVPSDVPAGHHEVRAAGLFGLSNPRTFVISSRDEAQEVEPNDTVEKATELHFDRVVNGRSDKEADVDCFKFQGKKGQRVIITCEAARIDSRFESTFELFSPDGRRIGHSRGSARRDAMLDATLPADGQYTLKVHDATYKGGAEFPYRLLATTGPHLDYILPPAGVPGTTAKYTLFGRNLPKGQPAGVSVDGRPLEKLDVNITLPADPLVQPSAWNLWPVEADIDGVSYTLGSPAGATNPLFVQFATAPVVLEAEPNNEPGKSQKITVPGEFAGQFQSKGDVDRFEFDAKAGEVFYLEVFAERRGTTADTYLTLEQLTKNDKGEEKTTQITALDDNDVNVAANVFDTRSDDPVFRFQVPANGRYRISLRDRYFESRGDPTLVYRLAVRKEQPDFRLVAVPYNPPQTADQGAEIASLGLRKGDNRIVQVLAMRRDGFNGQIDLTMDGLPKGVICKGALVETGANSAEIVLTAAADAPEWFGHIRITGKARIGDKQITRVARPGTIVWNGAKGVPAVSRVSRTLGLAVLKEQAPFQVAVDALRLEVNQGRQILLSVDIAKRLGFDADVALTLMGLPAKGNIDVQSKPVPKGKNQEIVRVFVKNNATLGTYSLYLKSQAQVAYRRNPFAADRAKAEADSATPVANAAAEAAKKAAQVLDAATKKLAADTAALKAATAAVPVAQKAVSETQAVIKPATQEQVKSAAAAQLATAEAEAAGRVAVSAKHRVDELAASAKSVTQADQGTVQATAAAAAKVAELAQKLAANAAAVAKTANAAKTAADKKLADANAASQRADSVLAAAQKAVVDIDAAVKASTQAKSAAEPVAKETDAKSKAAAAVKAAADKQAADTAKAAAPQNLNDIVPSTPIILTVKRAPANLTAAVPGNGAIKRGAKADVKVTVQRVNGYAGPVTISLPLPPGIKGVSAAPVTIAPDKNEGVLSVQAAADATEGDLANMVIRGSMDFDGKAEVDAPIAIKVMP